MRQSLEDSFAAMAATELPGLRRFAYAVSGDWTTADDLVQGALERTYAAWGRAHRADDHGAYLRTVLHRLAISGSRRAFQRHELSVAAPPETSSAESGGPDGHDVAVDRMDLAQALANLAPGQRAVVVLRYLEDRPVRQVAEILGLSEGTVKSQCSDGLARLRTRLQADDATPVSEGTSR